MLAHVWKARDFALMPIVADCLEEHGCSCEELLTDLRGREFGLSHALLCKTMLKGE